MASDEDELIEDERRSLVPQYTDAQNEQLARNLSVLLSDVHSGHYNANRVDLDLLRRFHYRLFDEVCSHAGRIRGRGFGQEHLTFGPNRSAHRNQVAERLEEIFEHARRGVLQCEDCREALNYEEASLTVAVKLHAEVIRVHPFEDGNGRSSRALMNSTLVRLGLRPIAVEACKKEYTDCLNWYFNEGDLQPLLDLMLLLMAETLGG